MKFSTALIRISPLIFVSTLSSKANPALSQIIPDNTLGEESSTVNPRNETSNSIQGGAVRGENLFHSFQEFNVDAGRGVYFANPDAVSNIFSRVTGHNSSNILGTLGVDGAADLYLVNPNGIVFGENSSLDVQGSFTATTADAVEFGNGGLFSAVTPGESLLTISAPLGLQFGSTPGSIVNRSQFSNDAELQEVPTEENLPLFNDSIFSDEADSNVGLQVPTGENLTLVGGEIIFNGGEATASGGNINIGGLDSAGIVSINEDGLIFPEDVERANITFSNAADVDVRGTGGGNINLHARSLNIEPGEFDSAQIRAGITADSTLTEAQAGNITINTTNEFSVTDSTILNKVDLQGVGNAGNIQINTDSLTLNNGGRISTTTVGTGNAGEISITASNSIVIDGISAALDECVFCQNSDGSNSGVFSLVTSDASGNAGRITISANSLTLTNGGRIDATTVGEGNSGKIDIAVTEDITINGADVYSNDFTGNIFSLVAGSPSGIFSRVNSTAIGNAEDIVISSNSLKILNRGQINTSTSGQGNSGIIDISVTESVTVESDATVSSQVDSEGEGNAGEIIISTESLSVSDSGRLSANTLGEGSAGNITLSTESLTVSDAGVIIASTSGEGNAGNIEITATNSVVVEGTNSDGFISFIFNGVLSEGIGNGGNLTIDTTHLTVKDGGVIATPVFSNGIGMGGNIEINATESIQIVGTTEDGDSPSVISTETQSLGRAGDIKISTTRLDVEDGGVITAEASETGDAGNIIIDVNEFLNLSDANISTETLQSSGGTINIAAKDIRLLKNSNIRTNVDSGINDGGNINITADSVIAFDDSDIFAFTEGGQGGNITLDTPAFFAENFTFNSLTANPNSLDLNNRADLNATGAVSGAIAIPDVSFIQNGLTELANDSIDTNELVANSCVVPVGERSQGKFLITGSESLPIRPGNNLPSKYPTGQVRGAVEDNNSWQPGDPIVEAQDAYRLANGKWVLSRECSQ